MVEQEGSTTIIRGSMSATGIDKFVFIDEIMSKERLQSGFRRKFVVLSREIRFIWGIRYQ